MCGIFGYIGNKQAAPLLMNGLKLLEYRGYDSAGMAVINGKPKLDIIKTEGTTDKLQELLNSVEIQGNIGISHTRWATHGKVNTTNAHPHIDTSGKIAIVHNGIIENAQELKQFLANNGHSFITETDSEIVAHLLEHFPGSMEQRMLMTMNKLEGTFAIAAVNSEENKIVAARRGSPLVLGIGKDEYFLSSDTSAFVQHTKQVDYIDEDHLVVLENNTCKVLDSQGNEKDLKIETLDGSFEDLDLNGHLTFMHKEIFEQSAVIRKNFNAKIDIKLSKEYLENIRRIIITACGTSWHAALIGKHIIEQSLNIPVEVDYASEFRYRQPLISDKDLFIGISQSGETADTLAALREAKAKGATTIGMINVPGSTMAREVDHIIYINAGREIGVASTKAYIAQLLAMNLLNLHLDETLQRMDKTEKQELKKALRELPAKVDAVFGQENHINKIAHEYNDKGSLRNALFMGRGINFPTALEGALKLKEISYVHAEGYPAAEMKHGPIALIDDDMPSLFIANKDQLYKKVLSNMEEVKARGGRIIAISDHKDAELKKLCDHIVQVPKTHLFLSPIINVIPLQLFAHEVATLRELDVDKPRNLAKSVTVE